MDAAAVGLELQSWTAAVDFSLKMVALLLALHRRCHRQICHHTPAAGFRVNIDGDFLRKTHGDTAARGIEAAIAGGLAHFAGLPHIELDGDRAVVTSYLQILVPQTQGDPVDVPNHGSSKGFRVHRMTANRWELARTPQGWKIKRRTLRQLDGSEPARKILRQAIAR